MLVCMKYLCKSLLLFFFNYRTRQLSLYLQFSPSFLVLKMEYLVYFYITSKSPNHTPPPLFIELQLIYKFTNGRGLGACRTAKGNHPVTFAIAACETQDVSVTVLPSFGLSEGSYPTANAMWGKMAQVRI